MKQALLIIDVQQALIEGGAGERPVYRKENLIEQIHIVISKAHKAGAASLFVRDTDVAGGEGSGFQIYAGIHVPEEALVFDKQATNAFHGHFNVDNFSVYGRQQRIYLIRYMIRFDKLYKGKPGYG